MRLASLAPRNGFLSLVRCKLRLADGVATPAEVQDYQRILNVLGVTTRFVQNCTLSCPSHERRGNIA